MYDVLIRSDMSKQLNLAQQIRGLKPGKTFTVKTKKDREGALRLAKMLKDSELISFDVVSRENPDGTFKVGAI